jgi:hypothetical protein
VHGTQVSGPWRTVGLVVFIVAGFLLLSMGGAIVAAPATVPLMFLATRRHPTRSFRVAGAALGALTLAEVAWAVTFLAIADAKPWIWLAPLATAIAAVIGFVARSSPQPRVRRTSSITRA